MAAKCSEIELAIATRSTELLKSVGAPKRRFEAIAVIAKEGLPVQTSCRILGCRSPVSASGETGYPRNARCDIPGRRG